MADANNPTDDWPEPEDTGPGEILDDNEPDNIWLRGLFMLIFLVLFGVAEFVLFAFAVLQFLWMIFSKEKNAFIADTGEMIGSWLRDVALFQTGATEEKPFPWRKLDQD